MIHTLAVSNYRSLHDLVAPPAQLALIAGPNGSGKSNRYRALRLLAHCARDGMGASLPRKGGCDAVLWAGPADFSNAMKRADQAIEGGRRRAAHGFL